MAKFDDHIRQAESNLKFLECINRDVPNCFDWQVTVCFYTALHLVNAHLSHFGLQYRQHTDVKYAINPEVQLSVSKIPQDEYVSYLALLSLSRRARYLVNEKDDNLKSEEAFLTYDKHLAKAIRHLDRFIMYFNNHYKLSFPKAKLHCPSIRRVEDLMYIQLVIS